MLKNLAFSFFVCIFAINIKFDYMHKTMFTKTQEELDIENKMIENEKRLHESDAWKLFIETDNTLCKQRHIYAQERFNQMMEELRSKKGVQQTTIAPRPKYIENTDRKNKIEKQLTDIYKTITPNEERMFSNIVRKVLRKDELENYSKPITNIDNIKELQEILVQVCINYINEHNLTDIDYIGFSADGLSLSAKEGQWTPCTDSSINVEGIETDETGFTVRKSIGSWC
jgi:hypothetical protein